jgi:SAM-dependent methyltransferase
MGVDYHGLRFIQYCAGKAPLGATATIGRQHLDVDKGQILEATGESEEADFGSFCELLLMTRFDASEVISFDYSDYEGASVLCDLNVPMSHERQFDSVLDLGTTEHIFNVAQALTNIIGLCRVGGQILHVVPGNNFPGHGFWQFSPELFFSLYSERNGFSETEVFVAELDNLKTWWRVSPPENGARSEFSTQSRSYVMARTVKRESVPELSVQQSGYVFSWERSKPSLVSQISGLRRNIIREVLHRTPLLWRFANRLAPTLPEHADARLYGLPGNPAFQRVKVSQIVGRAASHRHV